MFQYIKGSVALFTDFNLRNADRHSTVFTAKAVFPAILSSCDLVLKLGRLLGICLVLLTGVGSTMLYAQNADQRAENIQNGLQNLFMSSDQSFYYHNTLKNNDPYGYGYWVTAHALETLADAYQRTRDVKYRNRMKSILAGIRKYNNYAAGTYRNDYYDDLEWLCLACFNCYNATRDPEFLDAVHQIWAEIKTGYHVNRMSWKKGCTTPCENSIANGPAIIIAVKLYQLEHDNANLQMAKDIHAWMKANVLNDKGGIWDSPTNFNEGWQFSYNSGMFIGACLELSLVTGNSSYIDDGIKASEFMMNYRYYNGGVFFLNETGQGDGGLFKGIFAKWFTEFVRVGNLPKEYKERYLKVIHYTADYAWANAVNKSSYLIGPNWSALPSGTIDLSTQASGVHLFESTASLNKVHVYQDINYGGFYSQLAAGNYTLAQLQAKGLVDNDITSFTLPEGYQMTVYENDNFAGASKTFTANTAWLADWNDRISSLKITDARSFVVTAYQDINYGGYSGGLDAGSYTLAQLQSRGIKDNDITSLKISPGYKVTVYDGDNFTGTSNEYTGDVNWIADWNDKISSLKITDIRPHALTVFQDVNYGGYSAGFDVGEYTLIQLQANGVSNNDITSFKIDEGFKVIVYDGDNFTGASKEFTSSTGWLADWNDKITSLRVQLNVQSGNGDGLSGNYFNGMNFETLRYTNKDEALNMNWGNGSPNTAVNNDRFSARWTGQVQPKFSGEYTFYINSDNGRRVWVNNQLVIDQWVDDWNITYSGKIALSAGQKYDIKVEYFENTGGAGIKLEWSSANQVREVIPTSQLYANPLPAVTVSSSATTATGPANLTLSATASDNDGVAKVDFYNGTTWLGSDNSAPYSFAWNNVGAGTYSITALATDGKGGVTLSNALTVTVHSAGNQLPVVSLTSPTSNASFNAPASIAISANASDADGSISTVEFYNGSTLIGTDNTAPYSVSWNNVAAGTYAITAKATDNSNATVSSSPVSITVKTVAVNQTPVVNLTAPSNNANFNAPASIAISANASDADGSISKVEFFSGSQKLGEKTAAPYSYTWTNVGAGTYTLTAKATDNSGASSTSQAVTVIVKTVATDACAGLAAYAENAGYAAGSKVKNAGSRYECKPWPYSGWCNGAAWAYAPGTGAYWQDAWTSLGSCTARTSEEPVAMETEMTFAPNPASDEIVWKSGKSSVTLYNMQGEEVMRITEVQAGDHLPLDALSPGLYIVRMDSGDVVLNQVLIKQ